MYQDHLMKNLMDVKEKFQKYQDKQVELEKILEWSERLEILEMALYDEAGGQRTEFAINQLRLMQQFAQSPGLTPLSSELEEGLADILTFAQAMFGGMNDARDGFASDIEHEKDVDDFV